MSLIIVLILVLTPFASPIVIDCLIYQCQQSLLQERIQKTNSYIDYYVVVEGEIEQQYGFCFDRLKFKEFNKKIVYVPIRNIPKQFNNLLDPVGKKYVDMTFQNILKLLALDEDVLLFSGNKHIISQQTVKKFKSENKQQQCYLTPFGQKTHLIVNKLFKSNYSASYQAVSSSGQCQNMSSRQISLLDKQKFSVYRERRPIPNTIYQPIVYFDQEYQPLPQLKAITICLIIFFTNLLISFDIQQTPKKNDFIDFHHLSELIWSVFKLFKYLLIQLINYKIFSLISVLVIIPIALTYQKDADYYNGNLVERRRLVFDCMAYNGQNHILHLKFKVTEPFVNFNILTEGAWSHTGVAKPLRFDYGQFDQFANRIIYLPIRNMPNMIGKTGYEEKYENQHLMRLGAVTALKAMGQGRDILVVGDIDQILSPEGFLQFDPYRFDWMGTKMRHFHYYFNRLSVFDTPQRKMIPNYWLHGTRITTIRVIEQKISYELNSLRFDHLCPEKDFRDLGSVYGNYDVGCNDHFIPLAGWHFTSVLDDEHLLLKMRQSADYEKNYSISNYEEYRKIELAPNGYNIDVGLFDIYQLPNELIKDVLSFGKKSKFAKYLVGIDLSQDGMVNVSRLENNRKTSFQQPPPVVSHFDGNRTVIKQGPCWQVNGLCTQFQNAILLIVEYGIILVLVKVVYIILKGFLIKQKLFLGSKNYNNPNDEAENMVTSRELQ